MERIMTKQEQYFNEDTWRVFRILSEFVEGFETMSRIGPAVSVFGSVNAPRSDPYYVKARRLCQMLAKSGLAVITGGGPGIMEAANRGCYEAGGMSVGLNITLPHEQKANPYTQVRLEFHYFFARLVMFVKYACSCICFPGGFGTLHEFYNSMTLIQTGKAVRFPVILVGHEFWDGLVDWMLEKMLDRPQPTIHPGDMELFTVTDDLKEIVRIVEKAKEVEQARQAEQAASGVLIHTGEGTVIGQSLQVYNHVNNENNGSSHVGEYGGRKTVRPVRRKGKSVARRCRKRS